MNHYERRLRIVEERLTVQDNDVAWVDVHGALTREQARIRLAIGNSLGVDPADPRLLNAQAWLVGDDPAQAGQDEEIIARWRRQQGITVDAGQARQRVIERLEAMARRLHAKEEACHDSL
jgi:hypothetical protein